MIFSFINLKKITDSYGVKEHKRIEQLFRHPLFFIGLTIKIFLIVAITPHIHHIWFLPFLSQPLDGNLLDPWTQFIDKGGDALSFPYGIVMFGSYKFLTLIGNFIDNLISTNFFAKFGFRLSSLIFDFGTLYGIAFIAKKYSIKILLLVYWCSPIMIYILYWHGQLDILPVFLLIICIALMHIEKPIGSGVFMALAILAKSSMLIALPFIIIYYLRNKRITNQISLNLIPLGFILLINLIFYFNSSGFNKMVINSPESNKLFFLNINYGDGLSLFLLPTIFLILLYLFWRMERINLDLLCISIGIGFFSILILLPPSPGWFLWIVPFLTFYQIKAEGDYFFSSIPFYCFFLIYNFLYASGANVNFFDINFHDPLIEKFYFENNFLKSLIFTSLQASGLIVCLKMYQFGIWRNNYYSGIRGKLSIGFTGNQNIIINSIINSLSKILVNERIINLSTENYKKWDPKLTLKSKLNLKNEKVFNLINFSKDFFNIINKRNIHQNSINLNSKNNLSNKKYLNSNIIFLSGFQSLDIKRIRDRANLKINLNILNSDFESRSKVNKKMRESNYLINKKYDLIFGLIKNETKSNIKTNSLNGTYFQELFVTMANGFFHESLVRNLIALSSLKVDVEQSSNLEKVNLTINGDISSEDIMVISKNMIVNSEDLLFFGSKWSEGMLGIIQLIIIIHIADILHQRST